MFSKSDYLLLGAAFFSFVLSVGLWFSGQRDEGFMLVYGFSNLAAGAYIKLIINNKK